MTSMIPAKGIASKYRFNWEQDVRQRVFKLSGVVDGSVAARLESAIINLGSRRLVVDLTDVTELDAAAAAKVSEIVERLGQSRVAVVADLDRYGISTESDEAGTPV